MPEKRKGRDAVAEDDRDFEDDELEYLRLCDRSFEEWLSPADEEAFQHLRPQESSKIGKR